jgi:hypothetical protein
VILQDFHSHQPNLDESSGSSLSGSMTRDLTASKVWLMSELERIQQDFSAVYILGSWYGNLALYMKLQPRITADQIILVEKNKEFLTTSRRLLDLTGADNVEYMLADANRLDYRQLGSSGVVVNTSLTNMPGRAWFLNIPDGTLVVIQGRDHDPNTNFESTQAS